MMRYKVIQDMEVETPAGPVSLSQGQVICLDKAEALPLIEAGLITPQGSVAYKVYSNILQAYLWVVDDEAGAEGLRTEGIAEPIYTGEEIKKLKGMDKKSLQAIHNVKQAFKESKIKDIKRQ